MGNSCEIKKAGNVEFKCYYQLTSRIIGGKWKQIVLFRLSQLEVARFGVLRREVDGITEKMLIQSLKELVKDGVVHRKVYRQVPPKVEYSLTEMGKSFMPILNSMFEWGKTYASYLVVKGMKEEDRYTPGMVFENIDELVATDRSDESDGQAEG